MKTNEKIDFSAELEKYGNKWIAISEDETRIIASDDSLSGARQKAIAKGEKNPILFKVPSKSGGFIL